MSYAKFVDHSARRRQPCRSRGSRRNVGGKSRAPVRLSLETLDERIVLSGTPQLVDINAGGASQPSDFVQIGAVAFFTADDGVNGRELWRTDGTPSGTTLVRDIRAGSAGSNPQNLVNVNGTLFFTADDGANGIELWKSDGTSAGTVMVANIGDAADASAPQNLTAVNGTLFFSADDGASGRELWKSDGTSAGTVLVKDIFPGAYSYYGYDYPYSSVPVQLTNVNGTLFFTAGDATAGRELWKSDGTSGGTVMVKDIFPGQYYEQNYGYYPNSGAPDKLTVSGGTLYFTATDDVNGRELWKSDGTAAGTVRLTAIRDGAADALTTTDDLVDAGGVLFFTATDDVAGRELWKTDGTASGTVRVKDISPGTASGVVGSELLNVDGVVYFSATDGASGAELWKSDGTSAGTVMVTNADGASTSTSPTLLTNVDGTIYYVASDAAAGSELWQSDGTSAGTMRAADIVPGVSGSSPQNLFHLDGTLLFSADNLTAGRELWTLDTAAAAGLATARLTIYVDSQQVSVPVNIGVDGSGNSLSQVHTTAANVLRVEPIGSEPLEPVTLGDFFATWRSNAGAAGNNASAAFSPTQLMGSVADTAKTVKMFVNGQVSTEFDDYVIRDGDEIVLAFGSNAVVSLNTNFGPIVMELFEEATPITVANFLDYINDGDYINSFFHRAAETQGREFVIQGGGFKTTSTTFSSTAQFSNVPTEGTIQNEPGISNLRGTVAMAKLGGDPNSATSQFFVNLGDNSFLDPASANAFTVFAQVLDMTTADEIAALPVNTSNPSPYGELPLSTSNQLVVIQSIEGLGEISGVKYVDANANGQRDSGEAAVAGATVYIDVNDNGTLDAGDISTTTDANGRYLLQVEPGTYRVRSVVAPGHFETEPTANAGYSVSVMIGIEAGDRDFGELPLAAPSGVDLLAASDTGVDDDDDLTRLNNASAAATLQFVVDGVASGAEVRIYADGVLIGSATATGTSVTVTTNGTTSLADGVRSITARQALGGGESDPSTALSVTIDATPPAAIASTAPDIAQVGQAYSFNADSPDEGQTGVSYSLVDAPTGMTIDAATGQVSWTPTLGQAVPQAFSIRVADAAGNAATQDVAMTVLGVIPAFPEEYTTDEDTPLAIDAATGVLANDGDENSGTLSATVVANPTHGTLTLGADGSFTYTPNADFNGTDTFTYKASDDTDESNVALVTIHVTAVNDPVGVTADAYTVNEDNVLTVNAEGGVLANDIDPDGDTLTAALATSTSNGSLTFNANGSFTYTPNANFNGTDSFTYTVHDGTTTSDPVTVTITVNAINDAPVGVADSYSVNEDAALTIAAASGVLANDTDVEGTTLTATVVTNPAHGTLTLNTDGSFTYTPAANFNGTDTFTYRASDGNAQSATTTVTITVVSQPDAPTAADDTFSVANDGTAHALTVLANDTSDPDAGQTLIITAVTQGTSGGTVSFTGSTLSYTPAAGFVGTETFTYTIRDTDNLTDTATVTVTVSEAAGNSVLGFVYIDGNGNGLRDGGELGVPGAVITLTGTESGGGGVSMTAISASDGSFRFDDLVAGTYQLSQDQPHAMLDGAESSTASTTGIAVGSDAFTNIVLSGAITVGELNFGERGLRPEYVSLRMFLASTPPQDVMLRETIALGEELAGNTSLATTIRNGDSSSGATNAPPLAVADSYAVATGGTLTVAAASGVLHNDVDNDGDTLTALVATQPASGTLSLAADGSFTYTPNSGFTGNDSFTYRASDGTATSNVVTVSINVHAAGNAPVAVVDSYAVNRNETLTVDAAGGVLANDSDADSDTLTAQIATQPTHGTLTLGADGSFTYTPNTGFVGSDSFTYTANDGTASSTAVTVSIAVLNTNVAPTTTADTYTTTGVLSVSAGQGVLANDTDSNGDTITALLFQQATSGAVSLSSDGSFTYTPNSGFTGTDTFTYTASDGSATSNVTTVTITVTAPQANVFSVAENSPNGTVVGQITPPSSATGDLLYDFASTVSGTPSHLQLAADDHLVGDPSAPVVLIEYLDFQCPVCLTYHPVIEQLIDAYEGELLVVQRHFPLNTPHPNAFEAAQAAEAAARQGKFHEYGNLLFDNQDEWDGASDPTSFFEQYATQLGLNLAQFQTDMQDPAIAARINRDLAVAEDNDFAGTPTFFLNGQEIDVDATFADFADLVDDELADVDNMFFVDRHTGEITVANSAALDFETSGPFTLNINVRTLSLTQSTVAVTIHLTDVNEAPTATANTYSTNRDVPLTVTAAQGVLANDTDVDGDSLTAMLVAAPTSGTLSFNADGSFTYTPGSGFSGSDSFTYQATDGSLSSTTTTVSITVNDVNTAPVAMADTYPVDENATLNVNTATGVLHNDIDANGDPLTASLVATTTHGALTFNADGSFSYTPNQNFSGTDTFTYVADDGSATSESVVVTIMVAAVNVAPVSVADAYMVAQNGTLSVNLGGGVLANDTDADEDTLTAQLVSQTANGTLTLNADGSFTYTPNSGFTGNDSFTYRASDGTTTSSDATVSITVTAANTFALAESAAADALVGQVTPPSGFGPGVRFEIEQAGLASQLLLAADDHLTGDPSASVVLIEYMDLSCPHCRDIHPVIEQLLDEFDGELLVVRRHLLLFNSTTSSFIFPHSQEAARAAEAAGRQGKFDEMVDKLFDNQDTWRSVSDPSTFFNQYAQELGLNLTQFASDQADPAIDERINRDRNAASALGTASTPTFYINGQLTGNPGTVEAFTPLLVNAVIDADAAVGIDRASGQLFVNNPGVLDAATTPTIPFNVIITDAAGARQTVPVTVHVHAANNAPAAANDAYGVGTNGTLAIDAVMGLLANDFDADRDSLTAQLVGGPTSGTLSLNADGSFTYTPNTGFTGEDTFTYVAKDSVAMSLMATARIAVGSQAASAAAIEAAAPDDDDGPSFDGELVDAVLQDEEDWAEA